METISKYDKYKNSGIEWIGEIPEHWKIVPIKRLVGEENTLFLDGDWIESKDIVFDTDGIRYITTGNIGEGVYKEQGLGYITQDTFDKLNCTEVLPFDLVISRLNPPIGRCCIIPDLGKKIITSVDNVILRPNKKFNKGFLKYVMSNEKYFEYTSLIARGATMQRISRSLLGDINIPVSFDFNEQTTIAAYLDRKTAEIDRIIANKQKLIALYEEEKQAIINQAVTKGLDPNVKMKDSGVEWLGEIPEHWKVKKLKYLVTKIGSGVTPTGGSNVYQTSGIPLLRSQNIYFDGLRLEDVAYISEEIDESMSNSRIIEKDILLNITGGSIGRCFYVPEGFGHGNVNQHVCILRPILQRIGYIFLYFLLRSNIGQLQIDFQQTGANREGLNFEQLKNFIIPLMDIKEQQSIIAHNEKECARLDNIIEKFNKQIELLQEYRTTLISEVVTGKIKIV